MSAAAEPLVAAAAAPSVSPAPASTPASTGAEGATGADQGALLTDEAILGLDTPTEGADAGATVPAEQPAATQQPAAPADAAQLTIDKFSPLFKTNPEVQSLWDKYSNEHDLLSKFGTLADAAKAAETIGMLGSVAELESLASKAADVDSTDAAFFGGTPEERAELVRNWYQGEGPHEFPVTSKAVREMVDVTLGEMQQRDPEGFIGLQDRVTRQALTAEKFPQYLSNLAQALESGQGIEDAAKLLIDRFGNQLGLMRDTSRQSPEAQRLAQERQALRQERQGWTQQQVQAAAQASHNEIVTKTSDAVTKALSELKIDGRPVFGDKSTKIKATIADSIVADIDKALSSNRVFMAQVSSLKAQGLVGRQKELAELTMRYVKLQLPKSVQAIVGEWTEKKVSEANGAAQRAAAAASRSDVAGGAASSGPSKGKPVSVAQMKQENEKRRASGQRPISDEEILGLPAS